MKNLFQQLSGMPFPKKVLHLWMYYKPAIFAALALFLLLVFGLIRLVRPPKQTVLEITAVNANPVAVDLSAFDSFLTDAGYDPAREVIKVDTSFRISRSEVSEINDSSYQILIARLLARDVYLCLLDRQMFSALEGQNAFQDLSEPIARSLDPTEAPLFIHSTDSSGRDIISGIILKDSLLHRMGLYTGDVIATIPAFSPDDELAWQMIVFLLQSQIE